MVSKKRAHGNKKYLGTILINFAHIHITVHNWKHLGHRHNARVQLRANQKLCFFYQLGRLYKGPSSETKASALSHPSWRCLSRPKPCKRRSPLQSRGLRSPLRYNSCKGAFVKRCPMRLEALRLMDLFEGKVSLGHTHCWNPLVSKSIQSLPVMLQMAPLEGSSRIPRLPAVWRRGLVP